MYDVRQSEFCVLPTYLPSMSGIFSLHQQYVVKQMCQGIVAMGPNSPVPENTRRACEILVSGDKGKLEQFCQTTGGSPGDICALTAPPRLFGREI